MVMLENEKFSPNFVKKVLMCSEIKIVCPTELQMTEMIQNGVRV